MTSGSRSASTRARRTMKGPGRRGFRRRWNFCIRLHLHLHLYCDRCRDVGLFFFNLSIFKIKGLGKNSSQIFEIKWFAGKILRNKDLATLTPGNGKGREFIPALFLISSLLTLLYQLQRAGLDTVSNYIVRVPSWSCREKRRTRGLTQFSRNGQPVAGRDGAKPHP